VPATSAFRRHHLGAMLPVDRWPMVSTRPGFCTTCPKARTGAMPWWLPVRRWCC
jgi:hypothetical protein